MPRSLEARLHKLEAARAPRGSLIATILCDDFSMEGPCEVEGRTFPNLEEAQAAVAPRRIVATFPAKMDLEAWEKAAQEYVANNAA